MKYISVLRGINVSGQKKIKMADLVSLYEKLGFENVSTYIQSGNVIFESNNTNIDTVENSIQSSIKEKYGYDVPTDVRPTEQLEIIFKECPFPEAELEENGTKVLVSFLSNQPSSENIEALESSAKAPEKLKVVGDVVYLHCPNGYGRSKLSNTFIEAKLNLVATTRNWKTVRKLVELSRRIRT